MKFSYQILMFASFLLTSSIVFVSIVFSVLKLSDQQFNNRQVLKDLSSITTENINSNSKGPCSDHDSSSFWDKVLDSEKLTGVQILQYFLWTNRSSCQLVHDFGGKMMKNPSGLDGQKAICLDPKVAPQPGICLIYSFGIDKEWSFDQHMERYGCEVFAFDSSTEMGREKRNHSSRIHFYNWGISHKKENYRNAENINEPTMFLPLSSIYDLLSTQHGNKRVIDYLKMDIEYSEWQVLPQIIQSGMLSKVRQLGIEFHLPDNESLEEYRERAKLLRLLEMAGMVRFDSKYNPWFVEEFYKLNVWGSRGYEIAWYNSKLLNDLKNLKSKRIVKAREFLNGFMNKII